MSLKHITVGAGAGASLMALVMHLTTPQLQALEGTRYQAYRDIGGVLTVCTGHTGPDVVVDKVYTPEQCASLTEQDAQKAAAGILKVSPHLIYHPMQLASAISFSYNIGIGAYEKSSVAKEFNAGNFQAGCSAMIKYVYVNGKFSQGVANRRQTEYNLCTSTLTPKGMNNVGTAPDS